MPSLSDEALSLKIESMMVELNPRGMQSLYAKQTKGTYLRAAQSLHKAQHTILIGTGFAVNNTFSTIMAVKNHSQRLTMHFVTHLISKLSALTCSDRKSVV